MLTEKEKIQRARMYLWKLHENIDPLTDQEIGQDSVLRQERMKKCLAYVVEVLGREVQALEKEEESAAAGKKDRKRERQKRRDFYLTQEEIDSVKLVSEPCVISVFLQAVNAAAASDGRKKLQAKKVNNWLVRQGYLEDRQDGRGYLHRELTERSAEIGITSRQGMGSFGPYSIILYDEQAQKYILEHIEDIVKEQEEE